MKPEDFETQARAICTDAGRDPDEYVTLEQDWLEQPTNLRRTCRLWMNVARELVKAKKLAQALQA